MACSKPKFEQGLNDPVKLLPTSSTYKPGMDGMIVYFWSDGSLSVGSNTKLRYQDISVLREAIKAFGQHLPEGVSGVFLITLSEALILNMDALKTIYPTVVFLGIFDTNNVFVEAHDTDLVQHCAESTRAEALACKDESKVHVLPKLSREEAVALFDKNQDIICHNPGKHPERWFNQEHLNARNSVSGCANSYQIFVRFVTKMLSDNLNKYDSELLYLCKAIVTKAVSELNSIQCQTSWNQYGTKFLRDLDILLAFKKAYQQAKKKNRGKDPKCTKQGHQGTSEEYPPKFLETYRLKIPDRGFLGKLFYNPTSAFRVLNKINQYTIVEK